MGSAHQIQPRDYGFQERLTLQAAMLRVKLRYLPEWIDRRQQIAAMYDGPPTGFPVQTPKVATGNSHVYYLYTILAEHDELKQYLLDHGVGVSRCLPCILSLHALNISRDEFRSSCQRRGQIFLLPMFPELAPEAKSGRFATPSGRSMPITKCRRGSALRRSTRFKWSPARRPEARNRPLRAQRGSARCGRPRHAGDGAGSDWLQVSATTNWPKRLTAQSMS